MKRTTYDPTDYAVLHEMGEYVAALSRRKAAPVDTNNHGVALLWLDGELPRPGDEWPYIETDGTVSPGRVGVDGVLYRIPSRERCVAEARRQLRWLPVRRAWWAVRAAVGLAWAWVAARRAR
jgi:hypothetical protein